MKLNPIDERIVIRKLEKEETTASGIVLPSSAQEEPQYAEVVAISEKIKNDDELKNTVKVGDRVIYQKYAGTNVKFDDDQFVIVKLEDVLAVVED